VRLSHCFKDEGVFETAVDVLGEAYAANSESEKIADELQKAQRTRSQYEKALSAMEQGEYTQARVLLMKVLEKAPSSTTLQLKLCVCEIRLGACDAAMSKTTRILRKDKNNSHALAVRAEALLNTANIAQTETHCKEALRLDPDEPLAKKIWKSCKVIGRLMKEAEAAVKIRDFEVADEVYTAALAKAAELSICRSGVLWCNLVSARANALLRLAQVRSPYRSTYIRIPAVHKDPCST